MLSKYETVEVSNKCASVRILALMFRAEFSEYFCDLRCTKFETHSAPLGS